MYYITLIIVQQKDSFTSWIYLEAAMIYCNLWGHKVGFIWGLKLQNGV